MNKLVFAFVVIMPILFLSCNSHSERDTYRNDSINAYIPDDDNVDANVEISLQKSDDGWYKEYRNKQNGHIIRRKYDPSHEEIEAYNAEIENQYRKRFRLMVESSKPLSLPFTLRMDVRASEEDPSYSEEYDLSWRDLKYYAYADKNLLNTDDCLIGYLPDTSHFFTLICKSFDTEDNMGYIITFDKNCGLISSQCMSNHSSVRIVEDVLIDENYFTIDNNLKIYYYFHLKTHYEDEAVPVDIDEEEEYENRGYIDEKGIIVYDTKREVNLMQKSDRPNQ